MMFWAPVSTNPRFAPVGKHLEKLTTFSTLDFAAILPKLRYLDLTNCTSAAQENDILVQFVSDCFNVSFLEMVLFCLFRGACGWHRGHTRPRHSFSRFFLGRHRFENGVVIGLSLCYRIFCCVCSNVFKLYCFLLNLHRLSCYTIRFSLALHRDLLLRYQVALTLAQMLGCYGIRSSPACAYRCTATLVSLLLHVH